MNAIFFGLKRAYHGTLRIYRRALANLGLTAARFDLLYAAREYRRNGVRAKQPSPHAGRQRRPPSVAWSPRSKRSA